MGMAREPDREAISWLRRRDPRGFDLTYTGYAARVRAFILRLSGRSDVADDIVQQTFLRLAERGPDLRADSDLHAWLFTVARNAFVGRARAFESLGDETPLESLASPVPDFVGRLTLGDVERALTGLPMDDRELLLLVGVEGMEPAQAAVVLGIEAAALRQRLTRARRRLLTELERSTNAQPSRRKATP
jgi:RNA polymerase sigma-70 factor (ECF subfamily)